MGGAASAADLTSDKSGQPEPSKPSCFDSVWDYLASSVKDCPLFSYGPFALYGNIDVGYGYSEWGAQRVGPSADKVNYFISEKQQELALALVAERRQHIRGRHKTCAKVRRRVGTDRRG